MQNPSPSNKQQRCRDEESTGSISQASSSTKTTEFVENFTEAGAELHAIRNLLWGHKMRNDVFLRWSQGFEFSEVEPSALVQKHGGPCAVIAPVQAYLLKNVLTDLPTPDLKNLTKDTCKQMLIKAFCSILSKCNKCYRIVTLDTTKKKSMTPCDDRLTSGHTEVVPLTVDQFHQLLKTKNLYSIDEVISFYMNSFEMITAAQYGVLLFLYSVILTKGIELVLNELADTSEPLIHNTYGYGSQALINLMLTGQAVAHVWDDDQDVGGLKLRGITEQSDIGFLTLMEQLRYCTVGSFYKNPRYPVWVMGSETHLTVLFSFEKKLVSPETSSEIARRVLKSYDPEGNNFIPTSVLQTVLSALDLVNDTEYVNVMKRRLDPEGLGIILLNAFMDEYYPLEKSSTPDTFDLMHYNGIPGSNEGNKVRYYKGSAIILESYVKSVCTSNAMMTCLQTKWPNIEINWHEKWMPSLN